MKIETVTTKIHTATFTADDLKLVTLSFAKGQVGVSDDAVASSDVTLGDDGSIKVEIVENVPSSAASDPVEAPVAEAPKTDAPRAVIPTTLTGAA